MFVEDDSKDIDDSEDSDDSEDTDDWLKLTPGYSDDLPVGPVWLSPPSQRGVELLAGLHHDLTSNNVSTEQRQ